jgi:hypothetical protein
MPHDRAAAQHRGRPIGGRTLPWLSLVTSHELNVTAIGLLTT